MSWLEASLVVLGRKGEAGLADLDRFLARAAIERVPVDLEQADLARVAFARRPVEPTGPISRSNIISYARADDEPFVECLHRDLEPAAVDLWWDRDTMASPGADVPAANRQRDRKSAPCHRRHHRPGGDPVGLRPLRMGARGRKEVFVKEP